MRATLFLIVPLVSFVLVFVPSIIKAAGLCHSEVAIEHFFFDLQRTTHRFVQEPIHLSDDEDQTTVENPKLFQSPVSLKLQCKGPKSCPEVNGTKVMLSGVPHHSPELNGVDLYVEETSGWLLFYKDRDWKEPLLLKSTLSVKEQAQGYVYFETKRGTKKGGVLQFHCE